MSYCTPTALAERYGDRMLVALTDRGSVATGAIDAMVVARAITDTDAMIDGYLASRYGLPLSEVPALLVDLALQIAIWKLHVAAPDPKIEADYKDALRTLRDLATGLVRLNLAGAEPQPKGGSGVLFTETERPMTSKSLKGFI